MGALQPGSERVAGAAALLLAALAGCGGGEAPRPHPVLVLGVDGLEPRVVRELLAKGRLPTLARFAEQGVVGRLDSLVPTYSPVIWTTIATGQEAEAHGIDFFHDERGKPYTSNAREVPALWNLASDAGRTVDCVNWWITWPAEPIRGRMLSSYAAQAQANLIWKPGVWEDLEDLTWPPGLIDELAPVMTFSSEDEEVRERLWGAFPRPTRLDDVTHKSITDLAWTYAADLTAAHVAAHLLRDAPADLTLAYLALPDVAGHRFWRYHEPLAYHYRVPEPFLSELGDYLAASYVETDRLLGLVLAAAPPDANVILLSDHGMHAYALDDSETATSGHHPDGPPGVFAALGPEIKPLGDLLGEPVRGRLGGVLDVAPLVLRLLGAPVPEHWPSASGGDLAQVLDDGWRRENRIIPGENPDAAFRAATPSRVPAEDLDRDFRVDFNKLGYAIEVEVDAGSPQGSTNGAEDE